MTEKCNHLNDHETSNTTQSINQLKKDVDKNCLSYFQKGIQEGTLRYPNDYQKINTGQARGLSDSELNEAKLIILEDLQFKIDNGYLSQINLELLFDVLDDYDSLHNEMGLDRNIAISNILGFLEELKSKEADFIKDQNENNPESIGKDIYDRYGKILGLIDMYLIGKDKTNSSEYKH